jgi:hypothetical protein
MVRHQILANGATWPSAAIWDRNLRAIILACPDGDAVLRSCLSTDLPWVNDAISVRINSIISGSEEDHHILMVPDELVNFLASGTIR